MIAETGTLWSVQPFFDDEDAIPFSDPVSRAKQLQVADGTARAYELARKHGISIAFGTDVLFDPSLATRQGKMLAKLGQPFPQMLRCQMRLHLGKVLRGSRDHFCQSSPAKRTRTISIASSVNSARIVAWRR